MINTNELSNEPPYEDTPYEDTPYEDTPYEDTSECIICLEELVVLPNTPSCPQCAITLHTTCLNEWKLYKNYCPHCKYTFSNPRDSIPNNMVIHIGSIDNIDNTGNNNYYDNERYWSCYDTTCRYIIYMSCCLVFMFLGMTCLYFTYIHIFVSSAIFNLTLHS